MTAAMLRAFIIVPVVLAGAHLIPILKAQQTNAQISGLVLDGTGASIAEASLKATELATNVDYNSVSNESGVYVMPQLLPGRYRLTVSKTGFKTFIQSDLTLRTGDRLSLNLTLEPGAMQTTVEVQAYAQLLTTDDASYSSLLDNTMITASPQLSRTTLDVTKDTPAVEWEGPHKVGTAGLDYNAAIAGTTFSLSGGQRIGTLISDDGAVTQYAEIGAVTRSIPPPDA